MRQRGYYIVSFQDLRVILTLRKMGILILLASGYNIRAIFGHSVLLLTVHDSNPCSMRRLACDR